MGSKCPEGLALAFSEEQIHAGLLYFFAGRCMNCLEGYVLCGHKYGECTECDPVSVIESFYNHYVTDSKSVNDMLSKLNESRKDSNEERNSDGSDQDSSQA